MRKTYTKSFQVYVEEKMAETIRRKAFSDRISQAEIVRRALKEYFSKKGLVRSLGASNQVRIEHYE